jgi:transposase
VVDRAGHEVIVAHAQKVRLITKSRRKDDRLDARTLARLARIDPELLSPVKHRSAQAQLHLTEIRARAVLVSARTALVNAARGLAKSYGERLRKCGTEQVRLAFGLALKSLYFAAIILRVSTRGQAGSRWRPLPLQMRRA